MVQFQGKVYFGKIYVFILLGLDKLFDCVWSMDEIKSPRLVI